MTAAVCETATTWPEAAMIIVGLLVIAWMCR